MTMGQTAGRPLLPRAATGVPAQPASRPEFRRLGLLADAALAISFMAFLAWQIGRHAMWRDELNAWGIVLASPSLADLFRHLHYEGHPGLWHLILWAVSFVTGAPRSLQVVQLAIGCGIIGLVTFVSPFNRGEKLLILLSYFLLFEYTVMSRNYGIGLLLAFIYARIRTEHPDRVLMAGIVLGLLANTNVFAFIFSGGLALELAAATMLRDPAGRPSLIARLVPAGVIYLMLVGLSVATFWPAADISWRTTGAPLAGGFGLSHLGRTLTNHMSALLPFTQQAFWAPQGMTDPATYQAERLAIGLAMPFVAAGYWICFSRQRRLLFIPALTFAGSVLFSLVFYDGDVRHWGIQFVAFLVTLWIARAGGQPASPFSWSLLGVNAVAGIAFTIQHWAIPFSNASATAHWLQLHTAPETVLIGTPDTHVAAVAEVLGRPAYFLDCRCLDTYLWFQKRRDDFSPDDVPTRLADAVQGAGDRPFLFLSGRPLSNDQWRGFDREGLSLTELAHIDGALTENFQIFAVAKTDAGTLRPTLPSGSPGEPPRAEGQGDAARTEDRGGSSGL